MKRIMYVMANIVKLQSKVPALVLDKELTFFPCHNKKKKKKKNNPHQKYTSRKCRRKLKFGVQLYYNPTRQNIT